ncbi:MAG: flavin reductase, partial [Candidatus Hodarchaeota archaeon]
ASRVYGSIKWYGQERLKQTKFTLVEAIKIHAPLVAECRAHLECHLHSTQEIGSGFIIFGEIIHASIWTDILNAEAQKRYELLDQIIFLEEKLFAKITSVSEISD